MNKRLLLLPCAAIFNFLIYYGGRALSANMRHHSLALALDKLIPFLPWTVLIYWGCYIFWAVNYYVSVKYDKGSGCRFIGAHFIGEAVCFLFFIFFPTAMQRPMVLGDSIAERIVSLTYQYDAANNLFPSIHCFASWLCWIGVRNNRYIPKWYQALSLLIAIAVCVSTLTVKQHVIVDVLGGIILAEASYIMADLPDRVLHGKPSQNRIDWEAA